MSVTNYYSVGGRILGEKGTGSSRVDYLSDGLGSATATVDQTASVLNTYRYKPYGSQLAKTGTAVDPRFLWVGTLGYRESSALYATKYIRARAYDQVTGTWTAADPTGHGSWPPYRYAGCAPTNRVDPTGLREFFMVDCGCSQLHPSCVIFTWGTIWQVDRKQNAHGWIVQHIVRADIQFDCCCPVPCIPRVQPREFWEAWEVRDDGFVCVPDCANNDKHWDGGRDFWSASPEAGWGYDRQVGEAMYFVGDQDPSPMSWPVEFQHHITYSKPIWFDKGQEAIFRGLNIEYDCCSKPADFIQTHGISPRNAIRPHIPKCDDFAVFTPC